MYYQAQTFSIPELEGISKATIEEHLGLYQGYVKHVNLIREKINDHKNKSEPDPYLVAETRRRLGFEFGGMRNHEYYFSQFEGGAKKMPDGDLKDKINSEWGSFEDWSNSFKTLAMTRGVGWAMLYYDKKNNRLIQAWVDEQHLGQLADLDIVLALDVWEHSYMLDYPPSQKKSYLEAFFKNLNWETVAKRV